METDWDAEYKKLERLWNAPADSALGIYNELIPKGKVLDLGGGEGRNAIFFAGKGYDVTLVDKAETAVKRCELTAKEKGLKIRTKQEDILATAIEPSQYSLIIFSNVLSFFNEAAIKRLIEKAKSGLKLGGLIYIQCFSTDDPSYMRYKEKQKGHKGRTFILNGGEYRHYFTKAEVLQRLSDFKSISIAEKSFLDIGHGKPHYHGVIEYLGVKESE